MKKFLIILITVFSLSAASNAQAKITLPEKTDHEKVNVYLFWSSTCSNCHNLIKYFATKAEEYTDYFEIVTYQVNNDANNSALSNAIAEQVGEDPGYVPLVVIGDSYSVLGWSDELGETITKEALKAYQDDEYTDIVAKKVADEKLDVKTTSFKDTCTAIGVKYGASAESKLNGKIVISFISAVVLLGAGGLVVLSKKK